jgi:outer membrane murein-binding lipoprotein Lpp
MSKSHNKKRNVGIIYEQLLRTMARSLIDSDQEKYNNALTILRNNFTRGSQLYKEFRLFNALVKTTVDTAALAIRILNEAHKAAIDSDRDQLRKEKAKLIKEINHTFDDASFYNQRIDEYRSYATIQTLLNDWRCGTDADLARVASYENKVCGWLMKEKVNDTLDAIKDDDVSNLSVKIMREKFNSKYGNTFNTSQQELIREYVFSRSSGKTEQFKSYLGELKSSLYAELCMYSEGCSNQVLNEKMDKVKNAIQELNYTTVDDKAISRFLVVSQLKSELLEGDDE